VSTANTPVLVGVAQVARHIEDVRDTVEPLDLMLEASRLAERDTGAAHVLAQAQSVRVIQGLWHYANPARYIAEQISAPHAQTVGTLIGGNYPQLVLSRTAQAIQHGEFDVALITGAETGRSAGLARKAGERLRFRPTSGHYDLVIGDQLPEHHAFELAKGIERAIQVYPMYENAIRFHRGETIREHLERVSALWARFNQVAQTNPHAWIKDSITAEEIRTPSPTNRAISFPYTKLMNANMFVDMGAALILCSVRMAEKLGIAQDRWIYPLAGAEGKDHFCASVRDNFHSSPGIRITGGRVLERAGVDIDDLTFVDLYSCFPSAVQIAAAELGLAETRDLTVTGGLTFGGGPLGNYAMHAIARMVELLRNSPGSRGLVTANGGNLYKHAHGVYSGDAPDHDFHNVDVQAEIDALPARKVLEAHVGNVTVESYTVMYKDDQPAIGHLSCLTGGGERTWVNTLDRDLVVAMTEQEFCGRPAYIDRAGRFSVTN
jgi:acetyl-CoA C-acetyltransferase